MKSVLDRFEEKYIVSSNGCWEWTASTDNTGYGVFYYQKKLWRAHRFSYFYFVDDSLSGPTSVVDYNNVIMHMCDNRICVNPDHLALGTQQDNVLDCLKKGRFVVASHANENNPSVKLTNNQVEEIRKLYETGNYTQVTLGDMFGVRQTHISRIVRKEQRVFIDPEEVA